MNTTLPNGARIEVTPLFATPVVLIELPDAARLNADLRRVIIEREKRCRARSTAISAATSRAGT